MLVARKNIRIKGGNIAPNTVIRDQLDQKSIDSLLAKGAIYEVDDTEVTEPVIAAPEPEPIKASAWTIAKGTLANMDLDALNMAAASHVKKHGLAPLEPFEDADEARAYMSKDLA